MFNDYVLSYFSTEPRRAKGIFNVLRGRRTVSTLFAGLTYQCLDQLDAWHGVSLERFMASADELVAQGDLEMPMPGYLKLTRQGRIRQQQGQKRLYQPTAWREFQTANVRRFTQLSQLALQVVSEAAHAEKRYYPITTDPGIQAVVKGWLRQAPAELNAKVYAGLQTFLSQLPSQLATVFVASLTGYQQPGQTDEQLAAQLDRKPVELLVMRKDLSCLWVRWLKSHQDDPCWALLAPLVKATAVSSSAWRTYQDFLGQQRFEIIARRRGLKLSTVREHLLEVAILTPDFPFEQVLTPARINTLTLIFTAQPVTTWQFGQVQAVAPEMDFFWFRLFQIMRCQRDAR